MAVYFTSDLHLGHRLVAQHRGLSVQEHGAAVAHAFRDVRPDDVVWILGDLTANARDVPAALDLIASLPGRKRLVLGNHDPAHPLHRDAHKWQARYFPTFESVQQSARIRLLGTEVLLSHFPYERDRGVSRYMQWRLRDEGVPLLHGHTHGPERVSRSLSGTPELHVGLDAWDLELVPDLALATLLPSPLEAAR